MAFLLGVDLGTSSVKAVVSDEQGHVLGVGAQEYPIATPQPAWAEQAPQDWWNSAVGAVQEALHKAGYKETGQIAAIGFSGQMHGTVLVDAAHQPVGPAIIWPDQRSAEAVQALIARPDAAALWQTAGTTPATGFMGPTLYWLRQHDPARLDQAAACLLPKDFLRLRLTGQVATDASDAAGTALFDIRRRRWSVDIIAALDLPAHLLPNVLESADVAGELTREAAEALGLPAGIPVVAGCADQAAQAVGNGLIEVGTGAVTIGTGGQVLVPLALPQVDERLRLHTFCHAPADRWYVLGAMLAAGLSLRWWRDLLGLSSDPAAYHQLSALAAEVPPGSDGLLFLPYLVGERAPHMDPLARGCFVGLTLGHSRGHLARAIMEGVAFALRQILGIVESFGIAIPELLASGNGMASPVWRQIVADVLGRPLRLAAPGERAGLGAALIAGLGSGLYRSYADIRRLVSDTHAATTEPDAQRTAFYAEHYAHFTALYPLLRPVMHGLSQGAG